MSEPKVFSRAARLEEGDTTPWTTRVLLGGDGKELFGSPRVPPVLHSETRLPSFARIVRSRKSLSGVAAAESQSATSGAKSRVVLCSMEPQAASQLRYQNSHCREHCCCWSTGGASEFRRACLAAAGHLSAQHLEARCGRNDRHPARRAFRGSVFPASTDRCSRGDADDRSVAGGSGGAPGHYLAESDFPRDLHCRACSFELIWARTPGKMVTGLTVVSETFERLDSAPDRSSKCDSFSRNRDTTPDCDRTAPPARAVDP